MDEYFNITEKDGLRLIIPSHSSAGLTISGTGIMFGYALDLKHFRGNWSDLYKRCGEILSTESEPFLE